MTLTFKDYQYEQINIEEKEKQTKSLLNEFDNAETVDQAIEAIKEKYKETLLENPVYIENIQIEYAPLPIEQNEGQLYEARSYQPLVAVTAKEENRLEKFYLNPLNWKEVQ